MRRRSRSRVAGPRGYGLESRFVPLQGLRRRLAALGCGVVSSLGISGHCTATRVALGAVALFVASLRTACSRSGRLRHWSTAPNANCVGRPAHESDGRSAAAAPERLTYRFVAAGFVVLSAAIGLGSGSRALALDPQGGVLDPGLGRIRRAPRRSPHVRWRDRRRRVALCRHRPVFAGLRRIALRFEVLLHRAPSAGHNGHEICSCRWPGSGCLAVARHVQPACQADAASKTRRCRAACAQRRPSASNEALRARGGVFCGDAHRSVSRRLPRMMSASPCAVARA